MKDDINIKEDEEKVNENNIKTKHNGIISFWKFMFSILIIIFHASYRVASPGDFLLFKHANVGIEFFFLISGWLMARSAFKSNENKSKNESLGEETFQYVWKKFKTFFPYMFVALIFSLIYTYHNVEDLPINQVISTIWGLFLLEMTGMRSNLVIGGHTWYISAMLLSMMILFPLIKKYKKNFTYMIAPLIVFFIGGYISHKWVSLGSPYDMTGFIYKGLLRAFFELSLGAILFEITNKIKNINFSKIGRILLTLIELGGFISIFIVTNLEDASSKYDFVMLLILCISITIAFSEKTIFLKFANNKLFYYLEKLSLPIYINHLWITFVVRDTIGKNLNYFQKVSVICIITIIFSMIIMQIIEKNRGKLFNIIKNIFVKKEDA